MTTAEKLQTIAENVSKVYEAGYEKGKSEGGDNETAYNEGFEAGKQAEYDEFWDTYQSNGERTHYNYAFQQWALDIIKPKYDIKPTGLANNLFYGVKAPIVGSKTVDMVEWLNELGIILDLSKATNINYLLTDVAFGRIGVIDATSATQMTYTFQRMKHLVTIDKFILKSDGSQVFSGNFIECAKLENITIEGTIGQNGFNVQWSTKLSKSSITSIINALSSTTSGLTVTLSKEAVDKAWGTPNNNNGTLTFEWAQLLGTKPNWTISLV